VGGFSFRRGLARDARACGFEGLDEREDGWRWHAVAVPGEADASGWDVTARVDDYEAGIGKVKGEAGEYGAAEAGGDQSLYGRAVVAA